MNFAEETPNKLRLIGYEKLTDHGFARPIFGASRNPNNFYSAVCWPPGDPSGTIMRFVETDTENVSMLHDDLIEDTLIGDAWLSVFIWSDLVFVGSAQEIWEETLKYHKIIAKVTPLTFLTLTEFDPTGSSERVASEKAYRWMRKKIGARGARSWYKDSYLRGTMIRLLRSSIPKEEAFSRLTEEKLYSICVHEFSNVYYFELPSNHFPLSSDQLTSTAITFESKTGRNLSFKAPPSGLFMTPMSVRDSILSRNKLQEIFLEAVNQQGDNQGESSEEHFEKQALLRQQESLLIDRVKDTQKWISLQIQLGYALLQLGRRYFRDGALEQSIEVFRGVLEFESSIKNEKIQAFAYTCIGEALRTLGQRVPDWQNLSAAVAAYRGALKQWSRDKAPLEWAAAQNDLGVALQTLGETGGNKDQLYEAVAAYRAALEERTREKVPLLWASTQNNLGAALWRLGESDANDALLYEATSAYRSALEERTRQRGPLAWAMTQNNLGAVLSRLGERQTGTALLKEAVDAFRSALEERTRYRAPLDWAMTQNNLGNALRLIGERESNVSQLEEAIAAYNETLLEYTRDRVPLDWAMTQNNLGIAMQAMGETGAGTAWLHKAATAYRASLEERTRDRVPLDWAGTQFNLANCLATMAERRSNRAPLLADAITHMENAVDGYREVGDGHWGPIAEKRLAELKARAQ